MSRPLRITYPGAIYHIINRGSRRDKIFKRIKDKKQFLSRLLEVKEKYGVIIHAYCIMDNHYHLLVETPNANISSFMKILQGGYANWFKAKYNQIGPLFQSRYKSVLVEDEAYLITLSAYIHLNPVRAGIIERAEKYTWSSCFNYFKGTKSDLLEQSTILKYSGNRRNYFHILSEMINNVPVPEAIYGKFSILGSDAFKEKVVRQKKLEFIEENKSIDLIALPEYKKLLNVSLEDVQKAVLKQFKVSKATLKSKTRANDAKKVYALLLKRYTSMKIVEISEEINMNYHAAGEMIRLFDRKIKSRKMSKLAKIIDKLKGGLYV